MPSFGCCWAGEGVNQSATTKAQTAEERASEMPDRAANDAAAGGAHQLAEESSPGGRASDRRLNSKAANGGVERHNWVGAGKDLPARESPSKGSG